MVRLAVILLGLAGAPALAQSDADRQDERWVCVPDENRQWRCGRGDQAPQPRPLPPEDPDSAAADGYEPSGSGLPGYLRQTPVQPADPSGDGAASAVEMDDEPETPADNETGAVADDTEATPEQAARAEPAEDAARYGIQLVAGRDRASVEAYRERWRLEELEVYRRTWEDAGGVWHVLLAGRFETVGAARRALDELPEDLRPSGAWVRPLGELDIPTDHSRDTESD